MVRAASSLLASLALTAAPATASEHIVTLGDSLTFAYEAEFGFRVRMLGVGTVGDGFGPEVRNWVEILNDPAFRKDRFDLGNRNTFRLFTLWPFGFTTFLFRHDYNWAIPGLKIDELRRFVDGSSSFTELLAGNPDFGLLLTALELGGIGDSEFALADLESQIQNTATRLTLLIGGNDINSVYGTIYEGGSADNFVSDFLDDAAVILDRVQELNPALEVVAVNVPHAGITPDVQSLHPTDPVKTGRVTAVLRDLNARLAALAASRGVGYADIFTPTLALLDPDPLCIDGIQFFNTGSTTGDLDYVWLNGELSANFHPNTNAHALIANAIIDAFNATYQAGIPPLTTTEILGGLLEKPASEIDMSFASWAAAYGLPDRPESDDSDRDGVPAGIEFALGLNPTLPDGGKLRSAVVDHHGGRALELTYPLRLPDSARYTLLPAAGSVFEDLVPFAASPVPGPDGLARAVLPMTGRAGFLRLEATIAP